ncbi:MAG: hypothetical protein PHD03_01100 [Bacilli bacterium]|nr:hypothetical protein [Bacilli bacterium]MDD4406950.1 hypothetical protein [Bacilli bacterium]
MKKGFKITLIIITSIVLLGTIFAFFDYARLKNDKKPVFSYRHVNIYNDTKFMGTKYYGLGYSIFDCKICDKKINVGPLYLSTYAWFIENGNVTSIDVIKRENCGSKAKKYYFFDDKRSIYTYCLDDIKITDENNNTISLSDYLQIDNDAIYYIIENFTTRPEASFDDGGSKIYSGEDFNILVCHTLSENNDIYIGTKQMGYNKGFCK